MKYNFVVTKHEIALPLEVIYDFQKSHWLIAIRLLYFLFQFHHVYAPKVERYKPDEPEPEYVKPTKAYADQRQKAKRNRRRKPKKAIANMYQLRGKNA